MMNLFICDDNPVHLRHAAAFIRATDFGTEYDLACFDTPQAVIERIRAGYLPDIAVLDIEMPKVDGITLAEQLNQLCPSCRIIFLTGFTNYTYDAYYADHIWYVLKNDMGKYLPAALKKAVACVRAGGAEPYLLIQQQRQSFRLPLKNVLYLERITYRTRVKTVDEELFVRSSPVDLIAALPSDSFIRCHQSYWVNAQKISTLVGQTFLLLDGTSVPISRTYRKAAAEAFRSFAQTHAAAL